MFIEIDVQTCWKGLCGVAQGTVCILRILGIQGSTDFVQLKYIQPLRWVLRGKTESPWKSLQISSVQSIFSKNTWAIASYQGSIKIAVVLVLFVVIFQTRKAVQLAWSLNVYNLYKECYYGKQNAFGIQSKFHPFNLYMIQSPDRFNARKVFIVLSWCTKCQEQ